MIYTALFAKAMESRLRGDDRVPRNSKTFWSAITGKAPNKLGELMTVIMIDL